MPILKSLWRFSLRAKNGFLVDNLSQAELANRAHITQQQSSRIGKGICREEGGARYNNQQTVGAGAADAGDSLATIKKLVFDDKKITMAEQSKDYRYFGW